MADGGISGLAVAVAAVGGFLVYAGIQDVPLQEGLREILSGKTPTGRAPVATAQFGSRPIGSTVADAASATGSAISGGALVSEARKHLGKKYVFGSVGPNTFDCSGLVVYCLRKVYDKNTTRFVTRTFAAWARSKGWQKVGERDIRSGDIVLKSGHMGIAISNTEMIHAPNATTVVKIGKIYSPRYMWSGWRPTGIRANAEESRRGL